ncbi:MAG: glutathione S-transferase N-terminal domain-containing protein [Saprospiraceae bacterium]|nr:glutathione S-transferase N-terminal domain-containing protein [Saprospiraceae bacterium]
MAKPIDVYYWPTPNGWKVTIMLEELGVPYNIIPVNIGTGEQFTPNFLKISPNNRMPAIVDHEPLGGGAPLAIFESGAILEYLAEKYGQFMPKDTRGKYDVLQWLYWQMANLGPNSGQANHFRHYAPEKIEYGMNRYTNEVNRLYGVMDIQLADRAFLAGAYSIADMASWPWIIPYERMGQDLNEFPNLKRWFDAVGARPAVIKGKAVGQELRAEMSEEAKKVLFGQRARK